MRTEAQKKAERNYRKKIKQIILRYYPSETEDYERAKSLGSTKIKKSIKENIMEIEKGTYVLSYQIDSKRTDVSKVIEVLDDGSFEVEAIIGDVYLTEQVVPIGNTRGEAIRNLANALTVIADYIPQ